MPRKRARPLPPRRAVPARPRPACVACRYRPSWTDQGSSGYTPGVVDGTVLNQSIKTALASGQFNRVPIINGTNHDEQRLFVAIGLSINFGHTTTMQDTTITAANYQSLIASTLGVSAATAAVDSGAVPAQRTLKPGHGLQRARHRCGLRLPSTQRGPVDIQVRADVRL